MADRSVMIRFETDLTSIEQAQKKIDAIESQTAKIKCEVDIDGKIIQTNIQDALKKVQDGKINQLKLNLDLSTLTKQLKQAESAASKTADQIKSDFENSTKSRTVETLRKNYLGKKSFRGKADAASEEAIKYYNSAIEKAESLKFDVNDIQVDVNEDQVYGYAKALQEVLAVIQDIQSLSASKGIRFDIDFDNITDNFKKELETLQSNAVDIIQNFGKTKTTSLPPLIEQIKSQFMELPDILSGGIGGAATAEIDRLREKMLGMTDTIDQLETALANAWTQGEYQALDEQLQNAEKEVQNLRDSLNTLQGSYDESHAYGSSMAEQLGAAEDKLEEYRQTISQLKSELSTMSSLPSSDQSGSGMTVEMQQILDSVKNISESLVAMKSVLVDVGDGQEFSPLLQVINNITNAVNELKGAINNLKFNVNLDIGSLDEKSAMKIEGRKQELLRAYQEQFAAMKSYAVESKKVISSIFQSPSDKTLISDLNKSIALFDESQYDNIDQKIKAYESIIKRMQELSKLQYGDNAYGGLDARYQKQVTQAKSNLSRAIGAVKTESLDEINGLFGNADFSGVISQLDAIATKMDAIVSIKNTPDSSGLDMTSEVSQMTALTQEIEKVTTSIKEKNNAFLEEQGVVNSVVGNELTDIGTLWATIDDVTTAINKMKSASVSGNKKKPFDSLITSLGEIIPKINELNDEGIKRLGTLSETLKGFSGVTVKTKSFENLIKGIKDLSVVDLSQLEKLKGIDFSGLGNLKYVKQADNALSKQSKSFISTQMKQIDSALARYRKAGVDEDSLGEIKNLSTLLNTNFTATALSGVQDINGEMASFVDMLSEAIDKTDKLAASIKETKQAEGTQNSELSKYNSLLTEEKRLLNKKIKDGKLGREDTISFNEIQRQRRELEKKNNYSDERRKAIYDDAREAYLKKLEASIDKADTALKGKTEDDFVDPDVYKKASEALKDLTDLKEKFNSSGGVFDDNDLENAKKLEEIINSTIKSLDSKNTKKGNFIGNITGAGSQEGIENLKELIRLQEEAKGNTVTFGNPMEGYSKMQYSVKTKSGELQKYVASIDEATGAVRTLMKAEEPYVSQGQKFINSLKGKFAELTRYITVMDVFRKATQFIKEGFSAVREINTAMTELKKVTDETTATYDNFIKTAGDVATTVGGTTSDIITSTADYARLGYGLNESTELAKNTAIYKNVGDGIDINTATEDIVSITKAYGIAADKSMEVIDVLNEVGNSYAISSSGIGEALKKSSSALAAGNNTFEESVSMITAMNEVLQDPALTGTTMKMLSLRIRGAKTDIED